MMGFTLVATQSPNLLDGHPALKRDVVRLLARPGLQRALEKPEVAP